jgi:ADP-heptose:LPS heptosyltransferase
MNIPFADKLLYQWMRYAAKQSPVLPLTALDKSQVRSVLLVLTTGLGDAVLSTPVFSAVRQAMPQARITLFVRAAWAPLFFAEPDVDIVVPYHGKWRRFRESLRHLRSVAPDLALVLHGNDPDILPITYLSGCRQIFRVPTSGTRYGWLLSNASRVEDRETIPGWHYIDNRLRILESVDIAPTRRTPVIQRPLAACTKAAEWLASRIGDRPYIVFHPWAADAYKTWPKDPSCAFLAAALERFPRHTVVLTGGLRERTAAVELAQGFSEDRVVVAAGEFDILGSAGLLAGAGGVIAQDTGLLHLAAALDVPTVGLYAPTQPDLVGQRAANAKAIALAKPLTCDPCLEKNCTYKPAKCMGQFGAAEVLSALCTAMEGGM